MKLAKIRVLICIVLILCLLLEFVLASQLGAVEESTVYISMPASVYSGDNFIARVCVSDVTNLKAYQIQLTYDKNVIQLVGQEGSVEGVSSGLIADVPVAVDMWKYVPGGGISDTIRITGRVDASGSASGSGYLAELHFNAAGSAGSTSNLTPTEGVKFKNGLFDDEGNQLATLNPWQGSSIKIVTVVHLKIITAGLPTGAAGIAYQAQLEVTGGYAPYTWSAQGLPSDVTISESGLIQGSLYQTGHYPVTISVSDSYLPSHTVAENFYLNVYPLGDANEDETLNQADVRKLLRIYLGLDLATAAADANGDGIIDLRDSVLIQRLFRSN